ncbi:MAG TPA: protease inhibitor I42 family protein [Gemmataceae bacterium]|nr:protease inhibitor I42 family protein [Gemmataceae bacterium]
MNPRKILIVLTALATASWLGLAALSASPAQGEGEKTTTVTLKEDGTKVKVAKGEILQLKLEALPSAGYSWQVSKQNEEQLKLQGKPIFERPDKKVIGGKVTQVFRFKAEAAGTSSLELEYKRPFEKDKPAAKTFKLKVTVE